MAQPNVEATPKVETLAQRGVRELPRTDGMRVCCIGAGYVGGPTMAVLASRNPNVTVTVVDSWAARIAAWNSDNLPVYEPGLLEVIKSVRGKNLFFVSDNIPAVLAESDVIFVSVNTPTKSFGLGKGVASNVKNVELVGREIARACTKKNVIVVEKSTVPCKTAETLKRILQVNGQPGLQHVILSNPEFLAEGTAIRDLETPSRVLIGGESDPASQGAVAKLAALYHAGGAWVPRERIITTNLWSSELSKLVANAFLAQRISSINSISALCEVTDADVNEVSKAIGTDPRIGPQFLQASVGFGGSCFKKDVLNLVYLCRSLGLPEVGDYWQQVIAMNEFQMGRFARTIVARMFNNVTGKRLAMLGFAFKKDTGDVRESAAAYVARSLLEERATLAVFDPKVSRVSMMEEMDYTCGVNGDTLPELNELLVTEESAYTACAGAHAVCILTEWPEFARLDWARIYSSMLKPAFVFDGRNILDHHALRDIGFDVYAIGKPLRHAGGAGAVFPTASSDYEGTEFGSGTAGGQPRSVHGGSGASALPSAKSPGTGAAAAGGKAITTH